MDCFVATLLAMTYDDYLLPSNLLLAVGNAIDGAVPVVGDQIEPFLELHYVDRPAIYLLSSRKR